jgi:hypothetical protein
MRTQTGLERSEKLITGKDTHALLIKGMGSCTAGLVSNNLLLQAHGYQASIKDPVFVMVDNHTMRIAVPKGEKVIHQSRVLEVVVQRNSLV